MATDTNFQKILDELKLIHRDYPDLRFGEILQISLDRMMLKVNSDLSDISSKKILNALKTFNAKTNEDRTSRIKKNRDLVKREKEVRIRIEEKKKELEKANANKVQR